MRNHNSAKRCAFVFQRHGAVKARDSYVNLIGFHSINHSFSVSGLHLWNDAEGNRSFGENESVVSDMKRGEA